MWCHKDASSCVPRWLRIYYNYLGRYHVSKGEQNPQRNIWPFPIAHCAKNASAPVLDFPPSPKSGKRSTWCNSIYLALGADHAAHSSLWTDQIPHLHTQRDCHHKTHPRVCFWQYFWFFLETYDHQGQHFQVRANVVVRRGVRSYAQCGCNVLAKFWRLVGCSKRLDW